MDYDNLLKKYNELLAKYYELEEENTLIRIFKRLAEEL
jgi:hypothetical protein